eukprot:313411-Rhodomonas_salina.1
MQYVDANRGSGVYLSPLYPANRYSSPERYSGLDRQDRPTVLHGVRYSGDTSSFGLLPNPPEPEQIPRVFSRPFSVSQPEVGIRSFATELRRPEYYGKRDVVTLASSYPSDYVQRERDMSPRVIRAATYAPNGYPTRQTQPRVDLSPRVIRLEDYEREQGRQSSYTAPSILPHRPDLSPRVIRSEDYRGQPTRDVSPRVVRVSGFNTARDVSPHGIVRATGLDGTDMSQRALAAFPFPPDLANGKHFPGFGRSQNSSPLLRPSGDIDLRRSGGYELSLHQISGQLYKAQKANESAFWMDGCVATTMQA